MKKTIALSAIILAICTTLYFTNSTFGGNAWAASATLGVPSGSSNTAVTFPYSLVQDGHDLTEFNIQVSNDNSFPAGSNTITKKLTSTSAMVLDVSSILSSSQTGYWKVRLASTSIVSNPDAGDYRIFTCP